MSSNKPVIAIRTHKELIERFQRICENENRSMSNMGELLIKRYVEEYEAKETREQERTNLKGKLSDSLIG